MAQITLNSSGVASNGTLALQSNGTTTAVTIDASQNVGIGTASPAYKLDVNGVVSSNDTVRVTSGTTVNVLSTAGGGEGVVGTSSNHALQFRTNNTERARILSSGELLVGGTSMVNAGKALVQWNSSSGVEGLILYDTDSTAVGRFAQKFNRNGTVVGSIQTTLTATSYVTSSDYRLKENIASMSGALDKVAQLKPVTYNWKADGSDGQGFIAHELQEVCPDCVYGEKDAVDADGNPVYQGIDTSFLVATLTAAIKEQQAIITSLTDRITALEQA